MTSPSIAQVAVGLPLAGPFDYAVAKADRSRIQVGMRVEVPFQHRRVTGYVAGFVSRSPFKNLKSILDVLDNVPSLPRELLGRAEDFSRYYGCSLGEAIETFLPAALRRRKQEEWKPAGENRPVPETAGETILFQDPHAKDTWDGVGARVRASLERREDVVFLVPERRQLKEFEPKLRDLFAERLIVLDKAMSAAKELETWRSVREGQGQLVLGTRSAVFAPVSGCGLVVMFEEENESYKQDQSPFYHARDVVELWRKRRGFAAVYVSAAPSAELWQRLKMKKAVIHRAAPAQDSSCQLVDLLNYRPRGRGALTIPLQNKIEQALNEQKRVLLYLNRRGFSTTTICQECGLVLKCPRCGVHLSYLYSKKKLVCYLCGQTEERPDICPQCHNTYLRSRGAGIEKMESELCRVFPQARVATYDRDDKGEVPSADIVVATRAIVGALDRFRADVTGVLDLDAELNRFDFRSAQRAFSLLVRLRRASPALMVQTSSADNYCLTALRDLDFEKFYREELKLRRELKLPPFFHLMEVGLRGPQEEDTFAQAGQVHARLKERMPKGAELLDPQPGSPARLRGMYRFTVMAKGRSVEKLQAWLRASLKGHRKKGKVILTVHVDP